MFSYFYASMQFNPVEIANNLKKERRLRTGFRPGKPTATRLQRCSPACTFFGAMYLGVVAVCPWRCGKDHR